MSLRLEFIPPPCCASASSRPDFLPPAIRYALRLPASWLRSSGAVPAYRSIVYPPCARPTPPAWSASSLGSSCWPPPHAFAHCALFEAPASSSRPTAHAFDPAPFSRGASAGHVCGPFRSSSGLPHFSTGLPDFARAVPGGRREWIRGLCPRLESAGFQLYCAFGFVGSTV